MDSRARSECRISNNPSLRDLPWQVVAIQDSAFFVQIAESNQTIQNSQNLH
ncbi:hypothetical protein ACWIUD_07230 [Helicobacter sp. 23-1044]